MAGFVSSLFDDFQHAFQVWSFCHPLADFHRADFSIKQMA